MDVPEYEVTLLLLTAAGAVPITQGADRVYTNPAELTNALRELPAGDSLLYLNPLPALSVTVSHLSEAQRAARAGKGAETTTAAITPPEAVSDDSAPNTAPAPEGAP